jgi:hypothetical protein
LFFSFYCSYSLIISFIILFFFYYYDYIFSANRLQATGDGRRPERIADDTAKRMRNAMMHMGGANAFAL